MGRLKPGTAYAARFSEQRAVDGARIPTLTRGVRSGAPGEGRARPLQYRNQDHAHLRRRRAHRRKFSPARSRTPSERPASRARATVQSFDWRTLVNLRRIAPEIERVCLTPRRPRRGHDPARQARPLAMDRRPRCRRPRRLGAATGGSGRLHGLVTPLSRCHERGPRGGETLSIKVIPWTVNERADMERLIAQGVDGIITDYPDRLRAVMADKGMPLPAQVRRTDSIVLRSHRCRCRQRAIDCDRCPSLWLPVAPRDAWRALRHRSRPQPGQFPAADAADVPGARRLGVSRPSPRHSWTAALELRRVLRARAPPCLGAGAERHQARRHGLGDARQHAGDAGRRTTACR